MNRNCEAEKRAGPCGYMLNANHAYRGHIEGHGKCRHNSAPARIVEQLPVVGGVLMGLTVMNNQSEFRVGEGELTASLGLLQLRILGATGRA